MNLKEKFKKFKEELAFQKEQSKVILKAKWDIGAEQGLEAKKKTREMFKGKNENK